MMRFFHLIHGLLIAVFFSVTCCFAQQDAGRAELGKLKVSVYFATNANPEDAGPRAEEIDAKTALELRREKHLSFQHYRALGSDTQEIFRSYENWAQPLKPSDEILIRFETRELPSNETISLDLELWLARKKILKTDMLLHQKQELYILGPEWRGGRLIIAVTPII